MQEPLPVEQVGEDFAAVHRDSPTRPQAFEENRPESSMGTCVSRLQGSSQKMTESS